MAPHSLPCPVGLALRAVAAAAASAAGEPDAVAALAIVPRAAIAAPGSEPAGHCRLLFGPPRNGCRQGPAAARPPPARLRLLWPRGYLAAHGLQAGLLRHKATLGALAAGASGERHLPPALRLLEDEPLKDASGQPTVELWEGQVSPGSAEEAHSVATTVAAVPATCTDSLPQGRLLLFDGTAVVYRSHFKTVARIRHNGIIGVDQEDEWVPCVFGALSTIVQLIELQPTHVAVVFDNRGMNFRHELYSEYKANRSPTPDAVSQAIPVLQSALLAMGVQVLEVHVNANSQTAAYCTAVQQAVLQYQLTPLSAKVAGVEADDVIATLTTKAVAAGMKVRIASPDKDFFQLLSPNVRLLRPTRFGPGIVSFGLEDFERMYAGLKPSQFVDVLALMGDASDNIPGVLGIGEKSSPKLIKEFGSVEKLLEQKEKVTMTKARKALMKDEGMAMLSKRLVALESNLSNFQLPFTWPELAMRAAPDGGTMLWRLLDSVEPASEDIDTQRLRRRIERLWARTHQVDGGS
eukprot:SM000039S14544  [mRNA]  locus=s39:721378:725175:+ [translate_table: standard]